jgi:hypothetical protein
MKASIIGDPSLLAKTVVQLAGIGTRLSIRYYVKTVEHIIGGDGYTCELEMVSDGDGGHSTESTVARGLELLEPGPQTRGRPNAEPAPETSTTGAAVEGRMSSSTPRRDRREPSIAIGAPVEVEAEKWKTTPTTRHRRGSVSTTAL